MRIGFVVERPTQFEAPFYRFAAGDPTHRLVVFYTGGSPVTEVYDPELGRKVGWGLDLTTGYRSAVVPPARPLAVFRRALQAEPWDLLVVNGYTRRPYLAAALAARRSGVPVALRLDSVSWREPRSGQAPRRLLALLLARLFDLFLPVGTLAREHLLELGVAAERIGCFPYAVDAEAFRAASDRYRGERAALRRRCGLPAAGPVVLAVTKHSRREAPFDLVRAAPHLPSGTAVLLVGDGPERPALEAEAAAARGRVVFAGYVPYPELPACYALADVFVHPVAEERWGVSVAEALACDLPVVTSDRVGAARDLLVPGQNGFVYPAGDARALADRVTAALALDRGALAAASERVLGAWGYAAAWRGLLAAAERARRLRAAPGGLP
jgi:glycosyltransferase involved in cell wall biosynthesis